MVARSRVPLNCRTGPRQPHDSCCTAGCLSTHTPRRTGEGDDVDLVWTVVWRDRAVILDLMERSLEQVKDRTWIYIPVYADVRLKCLHPVHQPTLCWSQQGSNKMLTTVYLPCKLSRIALTRASPWRPRTHDFTKLFSSNVILDIMWLLGIRP
jgi:hypothetical protein